METDWAIKHSMLTSSLDSSLLVLPRQIMVPHKCPRSGEHCVYCHITRPEVAQKVVAKVESLRMCCPSAPLPITQEERQCFLVSGLPPQPGNLTWLNSSYCCWIERIGTCVSCFHELFLVNSSIWTPCLVDIIAVSPKP